MCGRSRKAQAFKNIAHCHTYALLKGGRGKWGVHGEVAGFTACCSDGLMLQ